MAGPGAGRHPRTANLVRVSMASSEPGVAGPILTHAVAVRALRVARAPRPEALLAALGARRLPALATHRGRTIVACDPAEVLVGPEAWRALECEPWPVGASHAMAGGWMGLLAYDLGGTIERLPAPRPDPGGPPAAALGRYDTIASFDDAGGCTIASVDPDERALHDLATIATAVAGRRGRRATRPAPVAVDSSLGADGYRRAVSAARELIAAGDCYEVNLAQRLSAPWRAGPAALAEALWRAAGPTSHRAFVGLPGGAVVSASPERLLRIDGRRVLSEPIKGTARPGGAAALARSAKDRAEHVMIVDLVRNDLGRVAATGSVRVPRLMAPYRIGYADHLVSTVEADLAPGTSVADAVRAVFPGGSVTGAPKVRAMEVIRELEPVARGPAYGSVLAMGRDGSLEASVAIRTAWLTGEEARYWCGGAVVWDSDPETERREAWAKATPFLAAVGAPAPEG